jgi:hypothetical protein
MVLKRKTTFIHVMEACNQISFYRETKAKTNSNHPKKPQHQSLFKSDAGLCKKEQATPMCLNNTNQLPAS